MTVATINHAIAQADGNMRVACGFTDTDTNKMTDDNTKADFSRCIETCLDSLYGLALRLTRNSADAEDLVADAVTKAWSAFSSLEDRNRFRPWLFRILHNRFISDYRKKSIRPVEQTYNELSVDSGEDDLTSLLIKQPDDFLLWWSNPEREFVNSLLGADIMSAIETLPEAFRITVLLVNVEGLSYDEAAEVLDVPPGTVRSRMKRGRTLLQKALWTHARDAGLVSDEIKRCTS
jgi:RNA polymerase sigma-70 factor (ECF subfamily)